MSRWVECIRLTLNLKIVSLLLFPVAGSIEPKQFCKLEIEFSRFLEKPQLVYSDRQLFRELFRLLKTLGKWALINVHDTSVVSCGAQIQRYHCQYNKIR